MFTIYNATLVALMQVGVIVVGVLASGVWHKFAIANNMAMPAAAGWVYHYGTMGFVIPIVWLTGALLVHRSRMISDDLKSLTFWLGVLILICITIFAFYANISPCFRITWVVSGGDET